MIKPVKSSTDPLQPGNGPKARTTLAKPVKVADDDAGMMEFDFGPPRLASTAQAQPASAETPVEPALVEKEQGPTPATVPGTLQPHIAAAQQTRSTFSIDSIKITDLTGELGASASAPEGSAKSQLVPTPDAKPVVPVKKQTCIVIKTVDPVVESVTKNQQTLAVVKTIATTDTPAVATSKPSSHATTKTTQTTKESHATPTTTRNTTMALNQPSISDFRKNAQRQAKEQHAVSNVLVWIGYGLIAAVIFFAMLAALGGYSLKQMIDSQSVNIAQLDAKYTGQLAKSAAETEQLREQFDKLSDQLAAAANLMAKQQEQLKRTASSADDSAAILKARTREINDLRERVRRLENPRSAR